MRSQAVYKRQGVSDYDTASAAMKEAAVKVETAPAASPATGIYKVVVIAKLARFEVLKKALNDLGVTGMTMTPVCLLYTSFFRSSIRHCSSAG